MVYEKGRRDMTESTKPRKQPIPVAAGFQVRERCTGGMRFRFQAVGDGYTGPLRKSHNSAAADTHRASG